MKTQEFYFKCNHNDLQKRGDDQIIKILTQQDFELRKGCTQRLRKLILHQLFLLGWSNKIALSFSSKISVTAMKGDSGLCLQTGNVSRIYADLLKLQYLFLKRRIDLGIYILPIKKRALQMGQNMANYERVISELDIFSDIITLPMLIIGLD